MSQVGLCDAEVAVGQETPPQLRSERQQPTLTNGVGEQGTIIEQKVKETSPPEGMLIPTIMITSPVTSPEVESAQEADEYTTEHRVDVPHINEEVKVQIIEEGMLVGDEDEDEDEEYDEFVEHAQEVEVENRNVRVPTTHKPVNLNYINDFPKADYQKRRSLYEPKIENRAVVCHSHTFPPAYADIGTYPTEEDLLAAEQTYYQNSYHATSHIEPLDANVPPHIEVTLRRLPTFGKLIIAESQPKDIKQYTVRHLYLTCFNTKHTF